MGKPTKVARSPIMDFHAMIRFAEEKHNFKIRGYTGIGKGDDEEHYDKYCRVTGDAQPNDGKYPDVSGDYKVNGGRTIVRDGTRRPATTAEYDADFKLIHDQYARYRSWSESNPEPDHRDYWDWLSDEFFTEIRNPCVIYFPLKEILDDTSAPGWVKEITQLLYDEFLDELDEEGGIEVEIVW